MLSRLCLFQGNAAQQSYIHSLAEELDSPSPALREKLRRISGPILPTDFYGTTRRRHSHRRLLGGKVEPEKLVPTCKLLPCVGLRPHYHSTHCSATVNADDHPLNTCFIGWQLSLTHYRDERAIVPSLVSSTKRRGGNSPQGSVVISSTVQLLIYMSTGISTAQCIQLRVRCASGRIHLFFSCNAAAFPPLVSSECSGGVEGLGHFGRIRGACVRPQIHHAFDS